MATEDLAQKFTSKGKKKFKLRQASICYYGFHDSAKSEKLLLPAWIFTFEDKGRLYHRYVNAHSNEAMNYDADFAAARQKQSKE